MTDLVFFLVALCSFMGVFAGVLVSFFVGEELDSGKKYFGLVQKIAVVSVLALVVISFQLPIWMSIPAFAAVYLFSLVSNNHPAFSFAALGFSFYSLSFSDVFFLCASLIFIFGIGFSSELCANLKSRSKGWKNLRPVDYGLSISVIFMYSLAAPVLFRIIF